LNKQHRATGRHIDIHNAGTSSEIETAFTALAENRTDALVVGADPLFLERRVQLVLLATRHLLPAVYFQRAFVEVGGLVSYAANDLIRYREVGIYTGRIRESNRHCGPAKPTRAGRRGGRIEMEMLRCMSPLLAQSTDMGCCSAHVRFWV
jgi:hypothetical protein